MPANHGEQSTGQDMPQMPALAAQLTPVPIVRYFLLLAIPTTR